MRIANLSADSGFGRALVQVATGSRSRGETVKTLDDADQVDAFFARQAG